TLDELTDVNTSGAMNGHVLKFDGTNWTPAPDETSGTSGSSLWQSNANHIYNYNSGNVGIGCTNPTARLSVENTAGAGALGLFKNTDAANTANILSVENNGDGYNIYSYKTGTAESVYLVKDNTGSGTPNIFATNNGSGNTMDVFATGTGYAGNFRGGPSSQGAFYAKTTSTGYAGLFDGDAGGGGIKATATGSTYAGAFEGRVRMQYDGYSAATPHFLLYETTSGEYARMNFQNASGSSYWSIAAATHGTAANAKMNFSHSGGGTLLTLAGDGGVGIANTDPTARLHVVGGASYANSVVKIENNNNGSVTPTVVITSNSSGELINASKTGVGYGVNIQKTGSLSSSAAIYGGNAGSNGEGVRGSAFGAGGYGVYGNATGNGSSSFTGVYGYGSGSTGIDYGVYGQQGAGANDYAGYFNGNVGYTGTLLATSDARLKTNVKKFNGGLNAVMQLNATTYEYQRSGELSKMNLPEGTQIGLIAQDIEKVLPELIKETEFNYINKKDGEANPEDISVAYKGVNYIGMIPVLINAIQEQQAQIEALQKQIEELKK
ncbi:MAG TPA: tail fiber domain-containing protein, partial [Chitinophagales bacterium]|nr:tail fiber domain-containing protein [Chitinophagales bacterium]